MTDVKSSDDLPSLFAPDMTPVGSVFTNFGTSASRRKRPRSCGHAFCRDGPIPEVASLFDHPVDAGAERRRKFERCRSASIFRAPGDFAERQILASLNHPGIAALLDAGHTSDGQPYLVMDQIDGMPIDVYAKDLDVRSTLRLFIRVCEAVFYAHQNLIVHRDIKPSNILVDKSGEPKLLDFGIAKLLQDEGDTGEATLLTIESGGALTPAYAAPEQVSGGPVTTATDVYALGVLLYVLLTGQHPAGAGPHSSAELLKAVVETEPQRLSDAIAPQQTAGSVSRGPGHDCREGSEEEPERALHLGGGAGRRCAPLSQSRADRGPAGHLRVSHRQAGAP